MHVNLNSCIIVTYILSLLQIFFYIDANAYYTFTFQTNGYCYAHPLHLSIVLLKVGISSGSMDLFVDKRMWFLQSKKPKNLVNIKNSIPRKIMEFDKSKKNDGNHGILAFTDFKLSKK